MSDESVDLPALKPKQQVWAYVPHGGFWSRTIRAGASGRVQYTRDDGRVVVAWDNGKKTAARRYQLGTEVGEAE